MFEHKDIEHYGFEEVPLNRDIYLMGEKWAADYERALLTGLAGGEWEIVGYISYAAARRVTGESIELSWYPNVHDRFHEMRVHLPRSSFIRCIGCRNYDEKPRIFVRDEWLTNIYHRTNSVFAMVDAIGVKAALMAGAVTDEQLVKLRARIDAIAARHPDVAFVSFADSLLLKANWSVGTYDAPTATPYEPEGILKILPEVADAYREMLGLEVYSIVTQGRNEFYGNELLHISGSKNHVSLNSLGIPFAQLQAIDLRVRAAIKDKTHPPHSLYMDDQFFHSVRWESSRYDKTTEREYAYVPPMSGHTATYIGGDLNDFISLLKR